MHRIAGQIGQLFCVFFKRNQVLIVLRVTLMCNQGDSGAVFQHIFQRDGIFLQTVFVDNLLGDRINRRIDVRTE